MPQFSVYRNKNLRGSAFYPPLVDVQSELLEELETRVVIPLARSTGFSAFPLRRLMPAIELEGERYVLMTPQLAGVPRRDLGPHTGSAVTESRAICTALDFLIRGF
jgi:toxin CcdB